MITNMWLLGGAFLLFETRGGVCIVPLKIVLAVKEIQYVEPLLDYVHGSEYGEKMRVSAFTKIEAFLHYMQGDERPNAVVAEPSFLEAWLQEDRSKSDCTWMVLSNGEGTQMKGPTLAKYQPLPDLLTAILNTCRSSSKHASVRLASQDIHTEVIGVVSVVGGSGKSTVALNLAKQMGNAGMSVFYLNLEMINSSAIFPRQGRNVEDAQGLPRLLYELKAAQEDKGAEPVPLAPFTVHHPGIKADLFEPVTNMKELLQMGKIETLKLLDFITGSRSYDVVIIDTDSGMNERTETVIEKSDRLVWVMLDDLINTHKYGEWMSFIERTEPGLFKEVTAKSSFVINRYVGNMVNALPACIHGVDGVLPYIPSWKQNSHEELLLSSPIYQRDIQKLCRHLLGDEFVVGSEISAYG